MQQGKSDYLLVSLSFNSYSTNGLAAIAANISDEFNDDEVVDDFEFSLVLDEFSSNAQIRSIFPIFNSNLLQGDDGKVDHVIRKNDEVSSIGIPLKDLFIADREERFSTSSSEFDDLEPIPEKNYCLWRPKFVDSSQPKWKKSRSSGQGSKRWKLLDLLRRSNSEGKGTFLFPTSSKQIEEKPVRGKIGNDSPKKERNSGDSVRKVKTDGGAGASLHEVFYLRNRAEKEGGKRKSYLPYRQNIVGFFASVDWIGKSSPL